MSEVLFVYSSLMIVRPSGREHFHLKLKDTLLVEEIEMDNDGGTLTKYLNGPGIDNKLRSTTGSSASYFLADHLGSTNGLSNSSGTLTASNSYDSFGNSTNANFPTRYQFTGREYDSFSGLQYSRARFYDPKLGKFVSEDPVGFAGGVNFYGYVGNNPQRFTDPMGLFPFLPFPSSYDPFPYKTGKEAADAWDAAVSAIKNAIGIDPPVGVNPLNPTRPYTLSEAVSGLADPLRVGDGIGCAIFIEDENGWGRAAFVTMDVQRGAGIFSTLGGLGTRFAGSRISTASQTPASTPVGRKRSPMDVGDPDKPPVNSPTSIGGRTYSGHSLDRMQGRGIPPSAVENTIRHGVRSPSIDNATVIYDPVNNITVVVNSSNGTVVTVRYGRN